MDIGGGGLNTTTPQKKINEHRITIAHRKIWDHRNMENWDFIHCIKPLIFYFWCNWHE